eukprot:6200955-Pleurochrysis_carterae.AAC.3
MNASIASSVSGPLCANLGASYSNDGARPSAGNRDEGSKLKSSNMNAAVVFCKSTNATSPLSRLATARTACMLGGALRASAASASASFSTKTCATGSAIASSSPRTSHEYRSTSSSECTRSQRDTFPLLKSDAASATTPPRSLPFGQAIKKLEAVSCKIFKRSDHAHRVATPRRLDVGLRLEPGHRRPQVERNLIEQRTALPLAARAHARVALVSNVQQVRALIAARGVERRSQRPLLARVGPAKRDAAVDAQRRRRRRKRRAPGTIDTRSQADAHAYA